MQAPTQVFETTPAQLKSETLRPGSVLLDSRPDFEYELSHVPGAVLMHWQDFAQKEKPFLGELELDLFPAARRLARYGIRPGTPVVVLGNGLDSQAEDYRLAWTLQYMGLMDVRVVNIKYFSRPKLYGEQPAPEPEAMWKPILQENLGVSLEVFRHHLEKPSGTERAFVLDVRPLNGVSSSKDLEALRIPWTDFFTNEGSFKNTIPDRLLAAGLNKDKMIVVIDEIGVKSAAVVLALRHLGYLKATNFAGGYLELAGMR